MSINKKIINKINRWQENGDVHPLICGKADCRKPLKAIEGANGKVKLICLDCNYIQHKIPAFLIQG